jgi:hypothetical protein
VKFRVEHLIDSSEVFVSPDTRRTCDNVLGPKPNFQFATAGAPSLCHRGDRFLNNGTPRRSEAATDIARLGI